MLVAALITLLERMPKASHVRYVWDGSARSTVGAVYLSKRNEVVLSGLNEPVDDDEDRPIGAPTPEESRFWHTPDKEVEWTR